MQSDKSKALIDFITNSINTLATMTDATAKSELFKTWLRAVSRFHHYSFNNQLLVLLQRPQAERVAGFHTWKSLGRNVRKGAKGIAILAPCVRKLTAEEAAQRRSVERVSAMKLCGFRVTHVFDIADTEGKDLPELEYRAEAGGETLLPRLESAAATMGIALEYRAETGSANGWSEGGKVVVNATLSTTAKCGTLAHELAHEFLHQHEHKAEKTKEQRELEAEATSFAVLAHFGIEQHSDRYLASWDTEDGMLEIDNSAAERALRAVALGRKNYLFAGSDCGGERAAAMYTLLGTAKLNGLDPELYLRTILAQIAEHPISRINELLPWNLADSLQTDSSQAA